MARLRWPNVKAREIDSLNARVFELLLMESNLRPWIDMGQGSHLKSTVQHGWVAVMDCNTFQEIEAAEVAVLELPATKVARISRVANAESIQTSHKGQGISIARKIKGYRSW